KLTRTFVISEDKDLLQQIENNIQKTLRQIKRQPIVEASLKHNHFLISVENFTEACDLINQIAPEHASIQTQCPHDYINHEKYVGALFLGYYSPKDIGDYVAGTRYVAPTNETVHFTKSLTVKDLITSNFLIVVTQQTYKSIEQRARQLAHIKHLYNHE